MFNLNEFVFYPGYGVCIVESISKKTIGSAEMSFYNIRVLENNAKIMIPVKNESEVGLRLLIKENEIQKFSTFLRRNPKKSLSQKKNPGTKDLTDTI
jgi:Transcriptional regulators, similar to M. xanthus CarD